MRISYFKLRGLGNAIPQGLRISSCSLITFLDHLGTWLLIIGFAFSMLLIASVFTIGVYYGFPG